jgi:hypothetical protein
MENFKEKYDDLIKRGFVIEFYEENIDYRIAVKYKAFCVSIKKNGKTIFKSFFKKIIRRSINYSARTNRN